VCDPRLLPVTSHILAGAGVSCVVNTVASRTGLMPATTSTLYCVHSPRNRGWGLHTCGAEVNVHCMHPGAGDTVRCTNAALDNLLLRAGTFTATDVYDHLASLAKLRAAAMSELQKADCLLVPTALAHFTVQVRPQLVCCVRIFLCPPVCLLCVFLCVHARSCPGAGREVG